MLTVVVIDMHEIGAAILWTLAGLFVAWFVCGIIDQRDESKREKRQAARDAEHRRQLRQLDIEKTIDTVRSGKWIYGRFGTEDWTEDQKARLAKACEIAERREVWRAERDAAREREENERLEAWRAEFAELNGGMR
jgi:hypothetical protein